MPEENSSFQNVNLFITAITKRGSSGSDFTVGLSEGSSFFISESFYEEYRLIEGMEISVELLEKIELESDYIKALHKAADLISRSEQSSGGLYIKLKKKGFSDKAIKKAVSRVRDLGLVDDERFAEMWISSRLRSHPEGRSALYKGLVTRGVNPKSAQKTLDECLTDEDQKKAVLKAGKKLSRKYRDSQEKVKNALYRRGFSNGEIQYFLENTDV